MAFGTRKNQLDQYQVQNSGSPFNKRTTGVGSGAAVSSNTAGATSGGNLKQELLDEQKLEIREAFSIFDMNGDGYLDYHECKVAFRALGFDLPKRQVLDIINEYDTDETNLINYDNFFKVVGQMILDRDPLDEIKRAFKLFDEDNTGKISLRNLRKIAKDLGENLTDEELRAMIDEFDLDEDGEINMSWAPKFKHRLARNPDKYTGALRVFWQKKIQGTPMPTFENFNPLQVPKHERKTDFEVGITQNDLVYVTEGENKGTIAQVFSYNPEYNQVMLSNHTQQRILPKSRWVEGTTSHIVEIPKFMPLTSIKLAGKDIDAEGKICYVVADEVVFKGEYYDDRYKQWLPKRFVKHHESVEIPWPTPPEIEAGELSTSETLAMEKTWEFQTISTPPIPTDALSEFRNPYSKYKTKKLSALDAYKLNYPEMPLTKEQKIYLANKEKNKVVKKLTPLTQEIKDFIGEKMANHINNIESEAMLAHLEGLSSIPNPKKLDS
ncbi:Cell division control protein 31 [Spathaspora sp. JA1]|nr:Cell division control protein 31 [Spathaspora sp. JA1]